MRQIYDSNAPRRAVNLSLNGDLVARARAARVNLSASAEDGIRRALVTEAKRRFEEEIARGVAEHNEFLAEHGSLSEAIRAMEEDGDA